MPPSPAAKRLFERNNMKLLTLLSAFVLIVLLGGCGWFEASRNIKHSRELRIGMTKQEVVAVMGEPVQNETYTKPDVWYYYTNPNWFDGLATEDECMPLVFKDGKLIGWGNEYYAKTRLLPPPAKQ